MALVSFLVVSRVSCEFSAQPFNRNTFNRALNCLQAPRFIDTGIARGFLPKRLQFFARVRKSEFLEISSCAIQRLPHTLKHEAMRASTFRFHETLHQRHHRFFSFSCEKRVELFSPTLL